MPLHHAAFFGELVVVQALLKHGADVNARDKEGQVPLHPATSPPSHVNYLDIIQLLLQYGADANARDDAGCTPLHSSAGWKKPGFATYWETVQGARLLLKHGGDIDAKDDEGRTPLPVALAHGRQKMAGFLTEYSISRRDQHSIQ
ncbi:ankyrin repeat-containing domain protein [Russula dissimulans]|nr:ankyrin repeat-containing domain protein [Russula dissimulans]